MNIVIGIYKITNLINGKSYIGQSVDIYRRWKQEKDESKNINSHGYDYPLMRAFRKYGIDNFEFEILEECNIESLNEKEIYWINFYNTFFDGYNQTLGGDTTSRQPKEKIIGVISDLSNTNMQHRDIAKKWDISIEMVQGVNTGRYWKHNVDYPLQKRKIAKIYYCEKCGKEITKGSNLCLECYNDLQIINSNRPDKDVLIKDLYDNKGNFTKVGEKYKVNGNSIRKWCIKYGVPSKSSDYKAKSEPKEKARALKISVIQLDAKTGIEINRFDSLTAAAKSLGLSDKCTSHISDVCKKIRNTAYGYKWEFA